MKNLKYLLGVGALALLPLTVRAADNKVTFNCPDTALPGQTIGCQITASSTSVKFGGMTAKYSIADGVVYDSISMSYSYPVNTNSATGFAVGDTAGFQKKELATVNFKLPSNAASNKNYTITLTNISLSDTEYNDYDFDAIAETVRIKSSNNNLSALSVTGATITFDAATKKYDLTIDAEKATIAATKADERATLTGTGEKTLKYGLNTFEVKVTSETGVTNVYTLNITRPDNRSTDKDLLGFAFNNYKIDFKTDKLEYDLTVENNISKLYECTEDVKSDKYICINWDKLDFNGVDLIYKLNGVEIDSDDIYDKAYNGEEKCENKVCTYSVNGQVLITYNEETDVETFNLPLGELKEGNNKLEVIITAENETTKTYTFNITRKPSVKNPTTGLFTGLGIMGLVGAVSAGTYVSLKRKNKFPNA